MTGELVAVVLLALLAFGLLLYWRQTVIKHQRRLRQLDVRVHVNGIRGKSSVTRLVAGVLREGGFITIAKTTGSAARVIGRTGEELSIRRRGAATIHEQIAIMEEHVDPDVEALVIECMAVRPLYQQYSQDYIVRSDITIITNVREDHQEEMGETLEQIADSLAVTTPMNGIVVTSEDRPHLRERLHDHADRRGSRFVYAAPDQVTDADLRGFDYLQFKENVAIGLEVAKLAGVSREAAMRGMWKAVADVGVVRLHTYDVGDKRVLWVPLFAANDRESVVLNLELLQAYFPRDATVIGILNNRRDRGRRAELFADMVPNDLSPYLDHVVTFGAYEDQVTQRMAELGYPSERIHNLGESVAPTLEQILETIQSLTPGEHAVLIGMVNIHTHQAELLMEYFAERRGGPDHEELRASRDPARLPLPVVRLRRAAARRRIVQPVADA